MFKLMLLSVAAVATAAETAPALPTYRIENIAGGGARLTVDQKSVDLTRDQAADLRKRLDAAQATETAADVGRLRALQAEADKAQAEAASVEKELGHAKEALQNARRDAKEAASLATAGKKSVRAKNSQVSQADDDVERARSRVETLDKSHDKARKEAAAAKAAEDALRKELATRTAAIRKILSEALTPPAAAPKTGA